MEALKKVCALLKVATLRKEKLPIIPGDHPKLDLSPLLCKEHHCLYQKLVGIEKWMVHIGRFDIRFAVTSLNHFSAAPMEGHLKRPMNIFGYLKKATGRRKIYCYLVRTYKGDQWQGCQ